MNSPFRFPDNSSRISKYLTSKLLQLADLIYRENPDMVMVTDEIGYGIVPADAFDREYREVTHNHIRILPIDQIRQLKKFLLCLSLLHTHFNI